MRYSPRRAVAVVAAFVFLGVALVGASPVSAATVGDVPKATWGVTSACPSGTGSASDNCANVRAVLTIGSVTYIAGDFADLVNPANGARVHCPNLAALDWTGAPLAGFQCHTFNGAVLALAASADGSTVFVGGRFSKVDGKIYGGMHAAAFDAATGAQRRAFNTRINGGVVRAISVSGSRVYLGGSFTTVAGNPVPPLIAVDAANGATDAGFAPTIASVLDSAPAVWALAHDAAATRLYVGGHFDTVNGVSRSSIAALSPSTGATDDTFNPKLSFSSGDKLQGIDAIAPVEADQSNGIAAGIVLGQAGHTNRAYRFDLGGQMLWAVAPDGDVQAVAVRGSTVYLGGHFTCLMRCSRSDALPRMHIAAVSYDPQPGTTVPVPDAWAPNMAPTWSPYFYGVWALTVGGNGDLWAGGVFRDVVSGGVTYPRPKVAAFPAV